MRDGDVGVTGDNVSPTLLHSARKVYGVEVARGDREKLLGPLAARASDPAASSTIAVPPEAMVEDGPARAMVTTPTLSPAGLSKGRVAVAKDPFRDVAAHAVAPDAEVGRGGQAG
jgi:hypothetical protein